MVEIPDIQQAQQDQYEFPYHHIVWIDHRGDGRRLRFLQWGFEYLLYMNRLIDLIRNLRPSSVLDVGCGDGYLLGHLGAEIQTRVGVDINVPALSFAKAFFPDVDYRAVDVANVEEDFDVVCAIEVLEHIPDEGVPGFLKAAAARMKPGGHLLISVPTTNQPLHSKHFRHYDLALLRNQMSDAVPELQMVASEFYYRTTWAERLYRRITGGPFLQGEIPALRRLVWRHARKHAANATPTDGLHLIAQLRKAG